MKLAPATTEERYQSLDTATETWIWQNLTAKVPTAVLFTYAVNIKLILLKFIKISSVLIQIHVTGWV